MYYVRKTNLFSIKKIKKEERKSTACLGDRGIKEAEEQNILSLRAACAT